MEVKKIELTAAGKRALEEELRFKKNEEAERIKQAIKEARDQGDLSENADYDAAKAEESANALRIKEIEEILKYAIIVAEKKITVKYVKSNLVKEFEICGSESNPFAGKISSDSPLAKAVLNHKVGDRFIMTTETGKDVEIELLSMEE